VILDEIIAAKLDSLATEKALVPPAEVNERAMRQSPARSFATALGCKPFALIAEVKKASPSRGVMCRDFDPAGMAAIYARGGVAAISVLTEEKYFQGKIDYIETIRHSLGDTCPPLLRKDFILDAYQVYQSRAAGADALLLIAAILNRDKLKELIELSYDLGMDCLVETHNESEIASALAAGAGIIGINNRDLQTFKVDLDTTRRLRPLVPPDRLVVSESGIRGHEDVLKMKEWGINAVLVGETLVSAPDIALKMKELIGQD
jgi:indole-3-glycerol phosphate synthase